MPYATYVSAAAPGEEALLARRETADPCEYDRDGRSSVLGGVEDVLELTLALGACHDVEEIVARWLSGRCAGVSVGVCGCQCAWR
jgi:hypothetical protein